MKDTFFRLACRIKSSDIIARSADYHDLEILERQVIALNAERGQTHEYFVERVKLNALMPWEVVALAERGMISLDQLERYSKTDAYRSHTTSIKELIQRVQVKGLEQS
ncbi:hypothetical protein H6F88_30125 [Oculatella sp. FACHB-28]|uniref:hypothetical protein n=1 Tax=Cyanophyceae TaxID=3028117 RepID=UPI001684C7EA|nr:MULTISPECIES: hypothetical protein [Cyanophyceae]MBD1997287.1 hypothetical protein [Leptolyngbya sp. FACHB-541]MBD2060205.1 hypothetical protein [Oculatella sp. FACHB-28]